jgi:hypothetical protein
MNTQISFSQAHVSISLIRHLTQEVSEHLKDRKICRWSILLLRRTLDVHHIHVARVCNVHDFEMYASVGQECSETRIQRLGLHLQVNIAGYEDELARLALHEPCDFSLQLADGEVTRANEVKCLVVATDSDHIGGILCFC